jgi:hypothetical protein
MSEQRFKRIISVLIGVTTAFTAILAQLESEARSRDDRAGRDARQASLSALGQQVRGSIEANHHYYTAFAHFGEVVTLRELAEARKDEKTAGDLGFQEVNLLSTSPLLDGQDPNGKPYFDYQNKHDGPDLARFEAYTYYINVQKDLQTFKAASKVKDGWSQKANSYVFHLTLLAISLFLCKRCLGLEIS